MVSGRCSSIFVHASASDRLSCLPDDDGDGSTESSVCEWRIAAPASRHCKPSRTTWSGDRGTWGCSETGVSPFRHTSMITGPSVIYLFCLPSCDALYERAPLLRSIAEELNQQERTPRRPADVPISLQSCSVATHVFSTKNEFLCFWLRGRHEM